MREKILIQSEDLDCGYIYSIHITKEQAEAVLNAQKGDVISLGEEGAWIHLEKDIVFIRNGNRGGTSPLKKNDILKQINDQLAGS